MFLTARGTCSRLMASSTASTISGRPLTAMTLASGSETTFVPKTLRWHAAGPERYPHWFGLHSPASLAPTVLYTDHQAKTLMTFWDPRPESWPSGSLGFVPKIN